VGTETPMRRAHVFNDSLRRRRATARSAPNFSMAAEVDGGSCCRALEVFGMHIEYAAIRFDVHIYIHVLVRSDPACGGRHGIPGASR